MKGISQFLNESMITEENKGNLFEKIYIRDFETKYREGLENFLGLDPGSLIGSKLKQLGGLNSRRPLQKEGDYIFLGSKKRAATVGDDVVDVEMIEPNGDKLNLSLKAGETVTFCNVGISFLFPNSSFDNYLRTGKFVTGTNGNCSGADLLDMFGIYHEQFAEVFVGYKSERSVRRAKKNNADITNHLKNNDVFNRFVESIVGYGYILVHELKNEVHYYDLRTESDMKRFIGNVQYAEIQYPKFGQAKRVDVLVKFDSGLQIKFNFRDKSGKTYPTQFMADYIINEPIE